MQFIDQKKCNNSQRISSQGKTGFKNEEFFKIRKVTGRNRRIAVIKSPPKNTKQTQKRKICKIKKWQKRRPRKFEKSFHSKCSCTIWSNGEKARGGAVWESMMGGSPLPYPPQLRTRKDAFDTERKFQPKNMCHRKHRKAWWGGGLTPTHGVLVGSCTALRRGGASIREGGQRGVS